MNYLEIEKVIGREILDSRGNPTVEATVSAIVRKISISQYPINFRYSIPPCAIPFKHPAILLSATGSTTVLCAEIVKAHALDVT